MVGLILIPIAVVRNMNAGAIGMLKLKGWLSSSFVKYFIIRGKLFHFILNVSKQI